MESLYAGLMVLALASSAEAQIFADFTTTAGNFTIELNHVAAPKTVANFIGLVEGSRAWLDEASGAVRTGVPYYNGVTFHRVIDGFMSQAGSRNRLGTDGPGYTIMDEMDNGLQHSGPGIISMANSATSHSSGAQFFITDTARPELDGKYTIFGAVTGGMATVNAINDAPVGPNPQNELSKPLNPVIIQSVVIRRIGAAAEAFNIHAQGLPIAAGAAGILETRRNDSVIYHLSQPQPAASHFQVYRSTDLDSWESSGELYRGTGSPGYQSITIDNGAAPTAFYSLSLVTYPDALAAESTANRSLVLQFGGNSLEFNFNATGNSGTGKYNSTPLQILSTNYMLTDRYGAIWVIFTDALNPVRIVANFKSQNATHVFGNHRLYLPNGSGAWQQAAVGPMTMTK